MRPKSRIHTHRPSRAIAEPDRSIALLTEALARGNTADATMWFERLNATHWIPRRPDLVPWLNREIGAHATELLVKAFATLPCHFCRGDWTVCPTCEGRGENEDGRACKTCAGLALGCCAACNGSGLVNYSAVPIGLRAAVMKARLAHAASIIRGLRPDGGAHAKDRVGARLQGAIAARAMLANAVRAASEKAPSFLKVRDAIPAATKVQVARLTRRLIADADVALRVAVADLAAIEDRAAQRGGPGADASARRATQLLRLAGRKVFISPLLFRRALGSI